MMSAMEHSTAGQPSISERRLTDAAGAGPGNTTLATLHIEHEKLPSLGGTGPILPVWLTSRLRRLFKRATPSH